MKRLTLSPEQIAVIEHPRSPLRVAAGAGTGKTTTIVERLTAMVDEGVDPARSIGITFTNKAADELRIRLREAIGARTDGREVEVATYHSFAASLLDEFGARIGYEGGGTLMDDGHRTELAARVLRDLHGTALDLTALDHRREELLTVADSLNDNLRSAEDLLDLAPSEPDDVWAKRIALAEAAQAFAAAKQHLGLIEYSDLIRLAVEIVTNHGDVAAEIGGRYDVVLLDEYQDTDPAQRLLLTTIFHGGPPVTAVGDTDQTIYEWRGASIENFDRFPSDFTDAGGIPAVTLPLSVNRRSDRNIIELANRIRGNLPSVDGSEPLAARDGAADGDVIPAWFATDREEARWIAEQMQVRFEEGVPYADMAVLCRTREAIRPIASALREAGLPYAVGSMGELLNVPEIADLMAWMSTLADPNDDANSLRILLGGKFRLGLADVALVQRSARAHGTPSLVEELTEHGAPPGAEAHARSAIERFRETYRVLFRKSQAASVSRVVDDLVHDLDYWTEVASLPPARSTTVRLNLNRFIDLANQWRPLDGHGTLAGFLRYLRALDETGRSEALDTVDVPMDDAVMLLTAHGAKGLEWGDVYVPGVAEKVFPSGVRLYHDPLRTPLVLPFSLRLDDRALAAVRDEPSEDRRKDLLRKRHLDQEWRLAYVAVTRARHRLVMSGHAWDGEIKNPRKPSPLLELAMGLPGAVSGPVVTDPGPRPEPAVFAAPTEPPDPLFEDGWSGALRTAVDNPNWVSDHHPELADVVGERVDQLRMLIEDLHVPTSDTPDRFSTSVTNLVAMAECPLKFRWIHHDRMPRRPRSSARRGTEFHRRIELHHLGMVSLEEYDSETDTETYGVDDRPTEVPRVDPWEVFTATRFHDLRPAFVETPFEITFDGRSLRGKIDAVYTSDDGWEIVDYKSGSARASDARKVQLQAYALAASRGAISARQPPSLAVTFAYFGEAPAIEVTEEVDDAWLQEASGTISHLLDRAERGPFDPEPSDDCRWCDFLHHCEAGKAHLAGSDRGGSTEAPPTTDPS